MINDLVLKMLEVLMIIAPLGIFCLIAKTLHHRDFDSILELLKYFIELLLFYLFIFFSLSSVSKIISKSKIINFFNGIKQALLFAFSTSSSSATIP